MLANVANNTYRGATEHHRDSESNDYVRPSRTGERDTGSGDKNAGVECHDLITFGVGTTPEMSL
jgi:hypothetical protein